MEKTGSHSLQSKWWSLLEKPNFATQSFRKEAQEHFGDQGYDTGQLFALCNDDLPNS